MDSVPVIVHLLEHLWCWIHTQWGIWVCGSDEHCVNDWFGVNFEVIRFAQIAHIISVHLYLCQLERSLGIFESIIHSCWFFTCCSLFPWVCGILNLCLDSHLIFPPLCLGIGQAAFVQCCDWVSYVWGGILHSFYFFIFFNLFIGDKKWMGLTIQTGSLHWQNNS